MAFRSVPRPSSPLSAKASTECPYLTLDLSIATPIARSEVVLNVTRGSADPFDLGVRSAETNGGDLIADSFLAAYDTYTSVAAWQLVEAAPELSSVPGPELSATNAFVYELPARSVSVLVPAP